MLSYFDVNLIFVLRNVKCFFFVVLVFKFFECEMVFVVLLYIICKGIDLVNLFSVCE